MPIKSFTAKKIQELQENFNNQQKEIQKLTAKSEKDLWISDLEELETAYKKFNNDYEKNISSFKKDKKATRKVKKSKASNKPKKESQNDKDKSSKPKPLPEKENLKRKRDESPKQAPYKQNVDLDRDIDLKIKKAMQSSKKAQDNVIINKGATKKVVNKNGNTNGKITSIKSKKSQMDEEEEDVQSVASDGVSNKNDDDITVEGEGVE